MADSILEILRKRNIAPSLIQQDADARAKLIERAAMANSAMPPAPAVGPLPAQPPWVDPDAARASFGDYMRQPRPEQALGWSAELRRGDPAALSNVTPGTGAAPTRDPAFPLPGDPQPVEKPLPPRVDPYKNRPFERPLSEHLGPLNPMNWPDLLERGLDKRVRSSTADTPDRPISTPSKDSEEKAEVLGATPADKVAAQTREDAKKAKVGEKGAVDQTISPQDLQALDAEAKDSLRKQEAWRDIAEGLGGMRQIRTVEMARAGIDRADPFVAENLRGDIYEEQDKLSPSESAAHAAMLGIPLQPGERLSRSMLAEMAPSYARVLGGTGGTLPKKPMTQTIVTQISLGDEAISTMQEVIDAVGTDPDNPKLNTGPLDALFHVVGRKMGLPYTDPDEAILHQNLKQLLNMHIYRMTGAQMNEQEAIRLGEELPSPYENHRIFMAKAQKALAKLQSYQDRYKRNLALTGYLVPGYEGAEAPQGATAPAPGGQSDLERLRSLFPGLDIEEVED